MTQLLAEPTVLDGGGAGRVRGLAVLVVDDHETIRRSISVTLESVNCVARGATSVSQAEAILERESFDLVILD